MIQFDFSRSLCIFTEVWKTRYENGSFPDKASKLEHMNS